MRLINYIKNVEKSLYNIITSAGGAAREENVCQIIITINYKIYLTKLLCKFPAGIEHL